MYMALKPNAMGTQFLAEWEPKKCMCGDPLGYSGIWEHTELNHSHFFFKIRRIFTYGKTHKILHDRELLSEAVAGLKLGLLQVFSCLLRPRFFIFVRTYTTPNLQSI